MKQKSLQLILLFCVLSASIINAQSGKGIDYDAFNLHFSYGGHLPGGDLKDRFGAFFSIGGGAEFLLDKGNWILGAESYVQFGGNIKESYILDNLLSREGEIIGNDGTFASVVFRQRGMYTGLVLGKLFPISSANRKSGIRLTLGGGYWWHKIRIQDDYESASQLFGDYKKGYDRLTGGIAIQEFIGYQHLDKNRKLNFIAGFEFGQGFTKSIREWNFDTMSAPTKSRLDISIGIRITWILPFYIGMPSEDIYY
jgi:hypothetical protein